MSTAISVIILTYNEAINISACLTALVWADDVIIVDSGSTDDTFDTARAARPDVRVFTHAFQDFGDQRNWALDNTSPKHEWILFVDADEFCSVELAREIQAFVRDPGEFVGAYIAGKNYFMGRWVKHASLYPFPQLRLLKLGSVRFRKEGHGQREETEGPCAHLKEAWRHEWMSKGMDEWIRRHNRYAAEEVEVVLGLREEALRPWDLFHRDVVVRRRFIKRLSARLGWMDPPFRFLYRYVLRGGWLDGRPGWVLCKTYFAMHTRMRAMLAERLRESRG